jgi:putative FmdB family regulatory protein
MPIYAYKCESCGHAKDVLQKMSDDVLTQCPECGLATYKKQLTAAGFQLKGSGWYVTDFREGSKPEKAADDGKADKKPDVDKSDKTDAKADAKTPAPATTPASAKSASPAPAAESKPAKSAEKSSPAPAPVSGGTAASTSSVASK